MATPESKAKDAIKKVIAEVCTRRSLHYKLDWHAGSAFSSTLDCTGSIAGHPVAFEVKRFDENETPTGRQRINLREFTEAGAFTLDIIDMTALAYLKQWLETVEPREPHLP